MAKHSISLRLAIVTVISFTRLVYGDLVINNVTDALTVCETRQFTWQDDLSELSMDNEFVMTGYANNLISNLITSGSQNGSFDAKVPYSVDTSFQYGVLKRDSSRIPRSQNYVVQQGRDSSCTLVYSQTGTIAVASNSMMDFTQLDLVTASCAQTIIAWTGGTPPYIVTISANPANNAGTTYWSLSNVTTHVVQFKVPFTQGSSYNITIQDSASSRPLVSQQPVLVNSSAGLDCILPFQPWSDPQSTEFADRAVPKKSSKGPIIGAAVGVSMVVLIFGIIATITIRRWRRSAAANVPSRAFLGDSMQERLRTTNMTSSVSVASQRRMEGDTTSMQTEKEGVRHGPRPPNRSPTAVHVYSPTDALSDCEPATLSYILDISSHNKTDSQPSSLDGVGASEDHTNVSHPPGLPPTAVLRERRSDSFEQNPRLSDYRKSQSDDHLVVMKTLDDGRSTPTGPMRKPSVARKPPPPLDDALRRVEAEIQGPPSAKPSFSTSYSLTPDPVPRRESYVSGMPVDVRDDDEEIEAGLHPYAR